jgi:hypothetical protein
MMAVGTDRRLDMAVSNRISVNPRPPVNTRGIGVKNIFMAVFTGKPCFGLVFRHGYRCMRVMATGTHRCFVAALLDQCGMHTAFVLFEFLHVTFTATVIHFNGIFAFACDGDIGLF